jgi:phage terminase small subunit
MNRHQRLNGKQRAFLKYYLGKDKNLHGYAARCYKAAYGLTDNHSAQVSASRLLHHPIIKELIDEGVARLNEQIVIDAGYVLKESKRLYDRAMGDEAIPGETIIKTDPETGHEIVQATERHEYDPATARQALQMIGQHKNVQAFTQTVEHSHTHRLEQRLAARSKVIEASAGSMGLDPSLVNPAQQLPNLEDTAATAESEKRVHPGGGQNDRSAHGEKTSSERAGATAK